MKEMNGRYPGGPSRREIDAPGSPGRGKVLLASVEDFEKKVANKSTEVRSRRRRKRVTIGLIFSVIGALTVGGFVGFSTHRTDAELAQEMDEQARPSKDDIEKQMDRLIDEMWKSEALEKAPHLR